MPPSAPPAARAKLAYVDLLLIAVATVTCVLGSTQLPESSPIRLPFGLLLSLVLPGYAVTAAAFPGRSFSRAERVLFTFGLSLALAILSGVALNWTPWGLTTTSLALFAGGTTLIACAIALLRRVNIAPWEEVADQAAIEAVGSQTMRFSPLQWATFSLAGIITVGALASAVVEARRNPANDVVQLWMVPAAGVTTDSAAAANTKPAANTVRIGVRNFENPISHFRLQLMRGGYIVQEWPQLTVPPGNTWEVTMTLSASWPGDGPVEAILYQDDSANASPVAGDPNASRQAFRKASYWLEKP